MAAASAAAQALSLPVHADDEPASRSPVSSRRTSTSQHTWRRHHILSPNATRDRPRTTRERWLKSARRWHSQGQQLLLSLTPMQRTLLLAFNGVLLIGLILFAIFHEPLLHWAADKAKAWRDMPGGWMILWTLMVVVSFPPVIGYSLCITISGFVWGMPGWLIVSTSSVVGSTLAFIVSRTLLKSYVSRLTAKNKQFAALSLVLKHDGLKLLTMIRLCPLPYSLSNGAISTIPTVKWYNFMLATALVTPKLLLHVFIGREIGRLAEQGSKMDTKTRIISYVSITLGILFGISVGYFIYTKTKARAAELEAVEEAAATSTVVPDGRLSADHPPEYTDDPAEREALKTLRRDTDVSLHTQFSDDTEGERRYRDEFTDDEDALERDVFDIGDGDTSEDDTHMQSPEVSSR